MKLAIIGYGNLAQSLEKEIAKYGDLELTAIYSRRRLDNKKYRPIKSIAEGNFDVGLITLGSYNDVVEYCGMFTEFNTVDSFDTHARIDEYKSLLNDIKKDKISVISTGWDPGLLSICRATLGISAEKITTVWGEGVSQGHSNALRSIDGVIDAVQFTVPKKNCEALIQNGETESRLLHDRICYVAAVESDKEHIERQIKSMPNYFADYDTKVIFVTPYEVRELKKRTSHRGQTFCSGEGFTAKADVTMDCNADYTAKIMLTYARAIPQLERDGYKGALDVFDIPLKYIANRNLI